MGDRDADAIDCGVDDGIDGDAGEKQLDAVFDIGIVKCLVVSISRVDVWTIKKKSVETKFCASFFY